MHVSVFRQQQERGLLLPEEVAASLLRPRWLPGGATPGDVPGGVEESMLLHLPRQLPLICQHWTASIGGHHWRAQQQGGACLPEPLFTGWHSAASSYSSVTAEAGMECISGLSRWCQLVGPE
jgi:hypothetical protein